MNATLADALEHQRIQNVDSEPVLPEASTHSGRVFVRRVLRDTLATVVARGQSGISLEELQLATRNHGMPLEALRHAITPPGLHYLLVHYDIPVVDPVRWTLELGGLVKRPLTLTLEKLRGPPSTSRSRWSAPETGARSSTRGL